MPHATAALLLLVLTLLGASPPAMAQLDPSGAWPGGSVRPIRPEIASSSPFGLADRAAGKAPATPADVRFYPARGASPEKPAPAVILLHGAGGVSERREGRYAQEFAAQGVAVAVIDVFGARGGGRFVERLIKTTEAMALADAFATLRWLEGRPDVDARRTALIGFSYGGMSAVFSAYRQVVDAYAPPVPFAAHVAFYGPCIARFDDPSTTGAPVMMLWGERDAIIDAAACETLAADLRRGGSRVEIHRYDARHRWDGSGRTWRAPTHIADCRLRVASDGTVHDENSFFTMTGPASRALILGLCANGDGYLIGGDEAVRIRSNAALADFLNPILFPERES
ncbi:dienelactone hydrolase family protein [Acuticoccus mangrovi]|uniref:Dienelactone hydrolase family protein n=1 Tax=Acuticoccus mangrovi TaxID=2796142 RepID=A0A934IF53_9HYPH|nr:dienelactone hydrolase family protein [Acuticoccus mangrovi]MBJ3775383.1 dienelactone hydrolase family protein [Acuticoccus mangrovi]